jgi:hypothetical protein
MIEQPLFWLFKHKVIIRKWQANCNHTGIDFFGQYDGNQEIKI